jgi:hypothetical protein
VVDHAPAWCSRGAREPTVHGRLGAPSRGEGSGRWARTASTLGPRVIGKRANGRSTVRWGRTAPPVCVARPPRAAGELTGVALSGGYSPSVVTGPHRGCRAELGGAMHGLELDGGERRRRRSSPGRSGGAVVRGSAPRAALVPN